MTTPVPVLPAGYVRNTTPVDTCPCQWGPSGHCTSGSHDRCHGGQPNRNNPETHIVSPRGWVALTPVRVVGTPCRWLCPCWCHTGGTLVPAPARQPSRRDRGAGGNARISTTDRLRDDDEPALFDLDPEGQRP